MAWLRERRLNHCFAICLFLYVSSSVYTTLSIRHSATVSLGLKLASVPQIFCTTDRWYPPKFLYGLYDCFSDFLPHQFSFFNSLSLIAARCIKAAYYMPSCDVHMSVCLSVCLSVTFVDSVEQIFTVG